MAISFLLIPAHTDIQKKKKKKIVNRKTKQKLKIITKFHLNCAFGFPYSHIHTSSSSSSWFSILMQRHLAAICKMSQNEMKIENKIEELRKTGQRGRKTELNYLTAGENAS